MGAKGVSPVLDRTVAWLTKLLGDGPCRRELVRAEAARAGFAWRTVRRAADVAGVDKTPVRSYGGGSGGFWLWSLPKGGDGD
jgi:hypothetical protein